MSTIMSHSPLNISEETVRDRDLIPKDRQQEMAYGESTVTWLMTSLDPRNIKHVERNISKTIRDAI